MTFDDPKDGDSSMATGSSQHAKMELRPDLREWLEQYSRRTERESSALVDEAIARLRDEDTERSAQLRLDFAASGDETESDEDADAAGNAIRLRPPRFHFRFIDLFAGIGGFRVALDSLGGECVFTSEWDRHARRTYEHWHGEEPHGDINEIDPASIPDHDILAAGFPCQPFSIAGVSKKNALGRPHGFDCDRQGNLFFRICDIVREKRPPVLILENVKNLRSHDRGRTWEIIRTELENQLDYEVHAEIIDAAAWVPQHRERIFIVCFDRAIFGRGERAFEFPKPPRHRPRLGDLLDPEPPSRYTLTNHLWKYLRDYAAKHKAKGNGFGFGLVDPEANPDLVTRTLSARYYKDGSEILVSRGPRRNPRRLTPVECARLMGFESKVRSSEDIVVSDTQAYKQFGNAVVPHVVAAVGSRVLARIDDLRRVTTRSECAIKGRVRPRGQIALAASPA